jgi:AbrB family looped-hinge helix DNA binding protein
MDLPGSLFYGSKCSTPQNGFRKESIMETVATSRERVVIPLEVRRTLGVKEGTYLHIEVGEQVRKKHPIWNRWQMSWNTGVKWT